MIDDFVVKKVKFPFSFEFKEINRKKIYFTSNISLANCLSANYSQKNRSDFFILENNRLNFLKLDFFFDRYLDLKKKFNFIHENKIEKLSNDNDFKLKDYQSEDVEKLSKIKKIGLFSEMRTGKTVIALHIFLK
jgi:superfamily II DNA or RNA helicase